MAKVGSKGKGSRSAGTGQFVTASFATKRPATTVRETSGEGTTQGIHRSTKTGEFLTTAREASRSKATVQNNKLEQIEKSVADLSNEDLWAFTAWFDALRWERWDRQFEEDVKAGRLDKFIGDAKAEIAAGKTRPL